MFAQIEYPKNLLPEELDKYLASGWFRMRQTIFTTNFLHFNQQFYSAIWLRVTLEQPIEDIKYQRLKKLNKSFRFEIKKAVNGGIGSKHEVLYQHYRQSIAFEVSPSLRELLYGTEGFNRFNTYEVDVYDGGLLIAAGFFDLGKNSAAGITCIYHPDYKKYSLGKYLMYLKMDFCRQEKLQYFYPGYMVPGYAPFDYKLDIGKASLQFLQLSSRQWLPYISANTFMSPLQEMVDKLAILQDCLSAANVDHALLYYKFFEANLDPYYFSNHLFDFPVFIQIRYKNPVFTMIVFDVCDGMYHLIRCSSVINTGFQQGAKPIFDADLLKVEQLIFATALPEEMAKRISFLLQD